MTRVLIHNLAEALTCVPTPADPVGRLPHAAVLIEGE